MMISGSGCRSFWEVESKAGWVGSCNGAKSFIGFRAQEDTSMAAMVDCSAKPGCAVGARGDACTLPVSAPVKCSCWARLAAATAVVAPIGQGIWGLWCMADARCERVGVV